MKFKGFGIICIWLVIVILLFGGCKSQPAPKEEKLSAGVENIITENIITENIETEQIEIITIQDSFRPIQVKEIEIQTYDNSTNYWG